MNKIYISPTSTTIPVSTGNMLCASPTQISGNNGIGSGGKTQSDKTYEPRSARESQIWGKEDMW